MDVYTTQKLRECGIEEKRINECDLSELDLSEKVLSGTDLRGFLMVKTNLEGSTLSGSDLRGQQFTATNCVSTAFVGADLRGANLAFGYFNNADFRGADLRGATLSDALCGGVDFAGADLRGAIMGTEHYDSDFRGADLRGVVLPGDIDLQQQNCDLRGSLTTPSQARPVKNKRRQQRVQLKKPLPVFDRRTRRKLGTVLDVTTNGLRLTTRLDLLVNSTVYLLVECEPATPYGRELAVDGACAWCRHDENDRMFHAGIRITKLSTDGVRMLEYLIEQNSVRGIELTD